MSSPRSSLDGQRSTHGSPTSHKPTSTTSSRGANPVSISVEHYYRPKRSIRATNTGMKPNASLDRTKDEQIEVRRPQVGFTMPVKVSGNNTVYKLYIDLGSPLTWIEDRSAVQKKAFTDLTYNVDTEYGDGTRFRGRSQIANVHFPTTPTETILRQFIAHGHLYYDVSDPNPKPTDERGDGILGLSPADNSKNYVDELVAHNNILHFVPLLSDIENTVTALKEEGIIGIFYTPYGIRGQAQVTFKGFDISKFLKGHMPVYTHVVDKASGQWKIMQTMKYGANKGPLPGSHNVYTIVDTGYPFIDLTSTAYEDYKKRTGAIEKLGNLVLTAAQYQKLESLWFNVNGHDFELTRDAQLWPRSLNKKEGYANDDYVLCIGNSGGNRMTYGYIWFQRFYVIINNVENKIGVVPTNHTHAVINEHLVV